LWRLDQQNKNANEIARQAGNLYDKFVNFVDDLDDIGKKIDSSKKSFTDAQNKLVSGTGNLVKRVETLKQLGAKTSKQLKADTLSQSGVDDEAEGAMAVDIDKANKENKEQKDKTRH